MPRIYSFNGAPPTKQVACQRAQCVRSLCARKGGPRRTTRTSRSCGEPRRCVLAALFRTLLPLRHLLHERRIPTPSTWCAPRLAPVPSPAACSTSRGLPSSALIFLPFCAAFLARESPQQHLKSTPTMPLPSGAPPELVLPSKFLALVFQALGPRSRDATLQHTVCRRDRGSETGIHPSPLSLELWKPKSGNRSTLSRLTLTQSC